MWTTFRITIILLILALDSFAQGSAPIIEAGEKLPDLPLKIVEGNQFVERKLSDFRGKKIIFDYWNRGCSYCIANFPKAEQIQDRYKDDLLIIAITNDKFEDFKKVREKYKNVRDSRLLFAVEDTTLKKIIPPPAIPFYIWVDQEGKLDAAVFPAQLNDSTLSSYIKGKYFSYNASKDYAFMNSENRFFIKRDLEKSFNGIRYNSRLKRSSPDMLAQSSMRTLFEDGQAYGIEIWNRSLTVIYPDAYADEGIFNETDVMTKDPTLKYIMRPCVIYQQGYHVWEMESSFDYQFFSKEIVDNQRDIFRKILQKDLQEKLMIKAEPTDTVLPVLELVRTDDFTESKNKQPHRSKGAQNEKGKNDLTRSASLASAIQDMLNDGKNCDCLNVIDQAKTEAHFDFNTILKDKSIESLNSSLAAYGLKLVNKMSPRKVIVLSRLPIGIN